MRRARRLSAGCRDCYHGAPTRTALFRGRCAKCTECAAETALSVTSGGNHDRAQHACDDDGRAADGHRARGRGRDRRRRDGGPARQPGQGVRQLADEPPHLRCAALLAARQDQQGERQVAQARLCGGDRRHCGEREPRSRRRSPRTASSTSSISGAWSTRSTAARAISAGSCGAWTPGRRRRRSPIAASRCGAIS